MRKFENINDFIEEYKDFDQDNVYIQYVDATPFTDDYKYIIFTSKKRIYKHADGKDCPVYCLESYIKVKETDKELEELGYSEFIEKVEEMDFFDDLLYSEVFDGIIFDYMSNFKDPVITKKRIVYYPNLLNEKPEDLENLKNLFEDLIDYFIYLHKKCMEYSDGNDLEGRTNDEIINTVDYIVSNKEYYNLLSDIHEMEKKGIHPAVVFNFYINSIYDHNAYWYFLKKFFGKSKDKLPWFNKEKDGDQND